MSHEIEYLSGVPYFRSHPDHEGILIMRLDGVESCVTMDGMKIIPRPDISVPPSTSYTEKNIKRHLESPLTKTYAYPTEDCVFEAISLLREIIPNGKILDERTIHFLRVSVSDLARSGSVDDDVLRILVRARIKVDPNGYLFSEPVGPHY